jgi:hypothetical protein
MSDSEKRVGYRRLSPARRLARQNFSGGFFLSVAWRKIISAKKFVERNFSPLTEKNCWTEILPTPVIFAQTILKYATRNEMIIRKNSDKKNFQKCLDHI